MTEPSRDPSIHNEPHLGDVTPKRDPSEARVDGIMRREAERVTLEEAVEHTVWDEPGLSSEIHGDVAGRNVIYAGWLEQKIAETSSFKTWLFTLLVVLVAGPCGVIGVLFFTDGQSIFALVYVTILGPLTEECAKVAIALWAVEKRPYLFKSVLQIMLCAAAGGAAFAFIENLLYLYVKFPNAPPALVAWRWTVCVALHVTCCSLSGVGLSRIWRTSVRHLQRPQLNDGTAWIVAAIVLHGLYNFSVTVAEVFGWLEF